MRGNQSNLISGNSVGSYSCLVSVFTQTLSMIFPNKKYADFIDHIIKDPFKIF